MIKVSLIIKLITTRIITPRNKDHHGPEPHPPPNKMSAVYIWASNRERELAWPVVLVALALNFC